MLGFIGAGVEVTHRRRFGWDIRSAGGTTVGAAGKTVTGLLANTSTALSNTVGGSAAHVANQLIANPGGGVNWISAAVSGVVTRSVSGTLSGPQKVYPSASNALQGSPRGTTTLSQLSNLGPRTVSGAINFQATNTAAMWKSAATGVVLGLASP